MSQTTKSVAVSNPNFNAQHSPMGSFMSFTCGHFGSRGGIGVEMGTPAGQDLYIGVKNGGRYSKSPLKCLPFYQGAEVKGSESFLVGQVNPVEQNLPSAMAPYSADQITRTYGWATDEWRTEDFVFCIRTPFGSVPDPAVSSQADMRRALLPAVVAELTVDNTGGTEPKAAYFAMNFNQPGWRPITGMGNGVVGFAHRRRMGVLGWLQEGESSLELFSRFTVSDGLNDPVPHLLGTCPGMVFEVPAGQSRTLRLVFGCYLEGIVTTGLEGRYLYTRYFSSLEDVLAYALFEDSATQAKALDRRLRESRLSTDQQFLIAHATRSYYGSTQLLEVGGEPFWVVNEGEYCMLNTLDLSVDQVFWELELNPWLVKNLLDSFSRHYSYVDQVKVSQNSTELAPGGISFAHDMGIHNNFSKPGTSSYELPNLPGCFSHMTQEQLCNWSLMAAGYVAKTNDLDWLKNHQHLIAACLTSMDHRDEPTLTGLMTRDSSRCGSGQEITTYDSLDASLGQSRRNLYLCVKRWSTYLGLAFLLRRVGEPALAAAADASAQTAAHAMATQINADGFIPAVLEKDNDGWRSRILAAIEGLIYPIYWEQCGYFDTTFDVISKTGDHAKLLAALKTHTLTLLRDPQRRNLFADGGIKLSSSSENSWMSKIAIFQQVCRRLLDVEKDPALKELMHKADNAHVNWQIVGSGYWACSDQFVTGVAKGSRYYPRIITTALWLNPLK